LGAKVLRDALAKQCVLVEDHDRALRSSRHGFLPSSIARDFHHFAR